MADYTDAQKDKVRDDIIAAIVQADKAAREQDESNKNYWEFIKPWTIKDPEKKRRVYRSYEANGDPVPEDGDSTWSIIKRDRAKRALRRAYVHGHPGSPTKKGDQNIDPSTYGQYEATQHDMQTGPYPEFNDNPINSKYAKKFERRKLREDWFVLDKGTK